MKKTWQIRGTVGNPLGVYDAETPAGAVQQLRKDMEHTSKVFDWLYRVKKIDGIDIFLI